VTIDNVEGRHNRGKSNDDVQAITLKDMYNLKFFPSNLSSVFSDLRVINVDDAGLTEITSDDLEPFPKLVLLIVQHNRIEVLRAGLFTFNADIEAIIFKYNRIKTIEPRVFAGLDSLRMLDLTDHTCDGLTMKTTREQVLQMINEVDINGCIEPTTTTSTTTTTYRPIYTGMHAVLFKEWTKNSVFEKFTNRCTTNEETIKNLTDQNANLTTTVRELEHENEMMNAKVNGCMNLHGNVEKLLEKIDTFAGLVTRLEKLEKMIGKIEVIFESSTVVNEKMNEKQSVEIKNSNENNEKPGDVDNDVEN
jgi:hypothetical protein